MTAEDGFEASTVAGDKGAVAQWTVRPGLGRTSRAVLDWAWSWRRHGWAVEIVVKILLIVNHGLQICCRNGIGY
jgi:hypothetical protein